MIIEESLVASPPAPPANVGDDSIHWFQSIAEDMRKILAAIPDLSDEQLKDLLGVADALGVMAWRVRAAVAHQILKRAQNLQRTGKRDLEGKGQWSIAAQISSELGVEPRTIIRDAEIHANFFAAEDAGTFVAGDKGYDKILTERGYYEAALEASGKHGADPHEVIEQFAQAKMANDHFSVSDARRHARAGTTPDLGSYLAPLLADPEVSVKLGAFQKAGRDLARVTHRRLSYLINQSLTEIEEELKDNSASWLEKLEKVLWEEKYDEADTTATRLGVDREWVLKWFRDLEARGFLRSESKPKTTDNARGATRTGYYLTDAYWEWKLKRQAAEHWI